MLEFAKSEAFTLGVEVELQIVDKQTMELSPKAPQLISRWGGAPRLQPEFFQSMIEISSGVCRNTQHAEADLRATATKLLKLGREQGIRFISTGTHPTARYQEREVFPSERYYSLIARNQWIVRRLLIFGLHVHIGMPDPETAISIQNELLYDLGMLLAISASSPYWQGEATGLASSRITVFEALPTGGLPMLVHDWSEFCELVEVLQRSHAIASLKDLWWDIRPSPKFGTIELRVCDGLSSIRETAMIVELTRAFALRAAARVDAGKARTFPPAWRIRENKWRASRHGMDAEYIISNDGSTEAMRPHLLKTLDALVGEGYIEKDSPYLPMLRRMGDGAPTSAERQKAHFARHGNFVALIRSLADEFEDDVLGRDSEG